MARNVWIVGLALLVVVIGLIYWPVATFGFVDFDDGLYVAQNPYVQQGLTAPSVAWAFTTYHTANWHPLTWLSLMLDAEIVGGDPRGYHLTNLVMHAASMILLALALRRLTGEAGPSLMAAGLVALHPLHVESVAWIASRKGVLSNLFASLVLWRYATYVEKPSAARMAEVTIWLALGLLAKQSLVVLPILLFLLDTWPLRRAETGTSVARRIVEKIPLGLLAAAFCVVVYVAQHAGGAMADRDTVPLVARLQNALVAYAAYLRQFFLPIGLSAFYPHPIEGVGLVPALACGAGLLVTTGVVVRCRMTLPYLFVGWLWFLIALLPVLGLIQVGGQARADRYMDLPMIGLALAVVWGGREVARRLPWLETVGPWPTALAAFMLVALAHQQVWTWRDTKTLFAHALAVTRDNYVAHNNLGLALQRDGDWDGARKHFELAIAIHPRSALARSNLANVLLEAGNIAEALEHLKVAVSIRPDDAKLQSNLARAYLMQHDYKAVIQTASRAIELDPNLAGAWNLLGAARMAQGQLEAALEDLSKATQLDPANADAHINRGQVLSLLGRTDDAIGALRLAIERQPENALAWEGLDSVCHNAGRFESLQTIAEETLARVPTAALASLKLAWCLAATSADRADAERALDLCQRLAATSAHPDPRVLDAQAVAQARLGRFKEAEATARRARDQALRMGDRRLASDVEARRALYVERKPFHLPSTAR